MKAGVPCFGHYRVTETARARTALLPPEVVERMRRHREAFRERVVLELNRGFPHTGREWRTYW